MPSSLDDRLKNEYSNQYALIIDDGNFYPNQAKASIQEIQQKIAGSAVPGTSDISDAGGFKRSTIDPFRQSLGKFWTLSQQNTLRFFHLTAGTKADLTPYNPFNSSMEQKLKLEDVSSQWANFFDKSVYNDTLKLMRKATRVKIFFTSSVFLKNKLMMLSLFTDMNAKNKDVAYTVGTDTSPQQIVFPKSSAVASSYLYNYTSMFDADQIYTPNFYLGPGNPSLGEALDAKASGDPSFVNINYESVLNTWLAASSEALNKAIQNGHLDRFYDEDTDSYAYGEAQINAYKDHVFEMPIPMSPRALGLTNEVNKNTIFADIKPRYNFYSKYYETGIAQTAVTLPDSDNQTVPFTERTLPLLYEVPIDTDGTPAPLGEDSKYKFENFGHSLLNCGYQVKGVDELRNFNIVLYQDSQTFLNKYESVRYQFPFFVDLSFSTDPSREFTEMFNKSGIMGKLVDTFISNFFTREVSSDGLNVEANKDSKIRNKNLGYFNLLDPDPVYSSPDQISQAASICQRRIYSINEYKDFYQVLPPASSQDKEALGDELIKESSSIQLREIDLNNWLDGYMKFLSTLSIFDTPQDNQIHANFKQDIQGVITASFNSKKFGENANGIEDCPDIEASSLTDVLKALRFLGQYREIVDRNSRSYEDILSRKKAYTETLFYRIQKVAIDDNGNKIEPGIIQNFWMPKPSNNQDSDDIMRYIDTQVKYGKNYEYTVYAYQIVIGSSYGFQLENRFTGDNNSQSTIDYAVGITDSAAKEGYTDTATEFLYKNPSDANNNYNRLFKNDTDGSRMAMFDVVCEPNVKLVEVPFYKKTVIVSDAASVGPQVDILPINGKKNEVKINFLPPSVDMEMEPIPIDVLQDFPKFNKIRATQDRSLLKAPISFVEALFLAALPPSSYVEPKLMFKSDDYPVEYEVYRLTTKPTSYSSFAGNKRAIVNAQNTSSLTEKLKHNRKYYYTFRSIDVHGNPSNPSPVYQVELVENSGVVYPVISAYEFETPPLGKKTKSFRKYLKIDAETLQGLLNLKESKLEGVESIPSDVKPILGTRAETTFDYKKFKFRVTSKHTGKILDLNVAFKTRHIGPEEEILSCGDSGQPTKPDVAEIDTETVVALDVPKGFDGL